MNIKNISDQELLANTKKLVTQERELLIEILHHLKEIDSRKLYLEIGYPSLWAYCTQELGYSEGSAQRRIESMRAIRELPVLEQKIESGELTLSNIAKAQSIMRRVEKNSITIDKKIEVFSLIENKSQKQADSILAQHFPDNYLPQEKVRALDGEHSSIQFTANRELLEKLEKVKSLFSHKNPNPTLSETLELMADFVISKKVPTPLLREVWSKAGGTCEYTDPKNHRRCGGRHKLEVEHVKPRAFGGGDEPENLKLYCRAHNVMTARQATLM